MITRDLAEFIASASYQDLPEKVVDQAKLCFLDFLGVSLKGCRSESAGIVREIISAGGDSTVIGGDTATPMDAALVNGVSAHCLDLDDGHRLAQLHPGACIIPAALALSESCEKSGEEFITAMVVGYQVSIQMGMFLNPGHRQKGFHSTGTCGILGAAAAASKIIDLDEEEILNALGLAGTQAAGLLESDHSGSMAKHLHAGKAAQSGVLSALLAKKGFTGAHTIIEGKEGLFQTMGDLKEETNLLQKSGSGKYSPEEFEILRVYFKKYPVCRHLHSSLDVTINLMKNKNIKIADIQDITVETYEIAARHNEYHPQTVEGIRQSLPVSLALAVMRGNLNSEDMERVNPDDGTSEVSRKIQIKCDKNLNHLYPQKRPSKVTIKTTDRIYTERIDLAKGEPENPFTKDELLNKFSNLNPQVDVNILKTLDDLEYIHINELMSTLNQGFK
ncbi:MmgE/PrpD family protein [Methanobacterium sp.]|uniref:MmgE/PrpD family protein n=1 Tax=Methanobacterium sp. TaxID=2164 RepID=UPI002ABAF1BC|nr:MmgE/PrpD family protein [Methanobacterium sp.]MDY9924466.1 MmgE/PrpD family protein [Methanobacterium sp.]